MNFAGFIVVAVFGVIWTIAASSMGAPFFFPLFGVVFVCAAVIGAIYHYKNATGKNRYSVFDITDRHEEPDPLDLRYGGGDDRLRSYKEEAKSGNFCPYCGQKSEPDHNFCQACGKPL